MYLYKRVYTRRKHPWEKEGARVGEWRSQRSRKTGSAWSPGKLERRLAEEERGGIKRRAWMKGAERGGLANGEHDGRKQTLVNEAHQGRLKRFPAAV